MLADVPDQLAPQTTIENYPTLIESITLGFIYLRYMCLIPLFAGQLPKYSTSPSDQDIKKCNVTNEMTPKTPPERGPPKTK